jgi:hypothetical protein
MDADQFFNVGVRYVQPVFEQTMEEKLAAVVFRVGAAEILDDGVDALNLLERVGRAVTDRYDQEKQIRALIADLGE